MKFSHYRARPNKCPLNLRKHKVRLVVVLYAWQAPSLPSKPASEKALSCTDRLLRSAERSIFLKKKKKNVKMTQRYSLNRLQLHLFNCTEKFPDEPFPAHVIISPHSFWHPKVWLLPIPRAAHAVPSLAEIGSGVGKEAQKFKALFLGKAFHFYSVP